MEATIDFDVIVVGAGFAGIYMLHRLKQAGLSVRLLEAGKDVGGVWYWNRYPGARCDVESLDYQFYFSDEILNEWRWPERYSRGPVIQEYLAFVTDRLGLREDISFETRVEAADYDAETSAWTLTTDAGATLTAQFVIMATGPLTVALKPDFPGLDEFRGRLLHTARWPEEPVDFSGRNVAVLGTGSSGIQCIPIIADQANSVTVFQRTPAFSMPVTNRTLDDEEIAEARDRIDISRSIRLKSSGGQRRMGSPKGVFDDTPDERARAFEESWTMGGFAFLMTYNDIMIDAQANEEASEFVRQKIRAKVDDPETAEKLVPTTYPIGTKRPCLDTGYYETFNKPNVSLVDAGTAPIERFEETGIVAGGRSYAFDDVVLATGFDALTGAMMKIRITGRDGRTLSDAWHGGPRSYLGLAVAGFPNLFFLDGPGSPSVINVAVAVIEVQVEWVGDCIEHMRANGIAAIEAREDAQDEWTAHVDEVAHKTLYPRAKSWGMGANIPGKPRGFMMYLGGLPTYRAKCADAAEHGYRGFTLTRQQAEALGGAERG